VGSRCLGHIARCFGGWLRDLSICKIGLSRRSQLSGYKFSLQVNSTSVSIKQL